MDERLRRVTEFYTGPKRTVIVTRDKETGNYVAHVPSMPGCINQAASREEVLGGIQFVMHMWQEAAAKKGFKVSNDSRLLVWREAARDFLSGYRPELVTVPFNSKVK